MTVSQRSGLASGKGQNEVGVGGGEAEITHVGRSVPQWVRFQLGTQRSSRSLKEVGLVEKSICRRANSMFVFRHLITIESENS